MRKIDKIEITDPVTIARMRDLRKQHIKTYTETRKKPLTSDFYKEFKEFLLKSHFQKCAYCESKIENQPGDVEHFRPKGRITELDGKRVTMRLGDEDIEHPGYFWLAYDVGNLLMSCIDCNRRRRHVSDESGEATSHGKEDIFPVDGIRALPPNDPEAANDGIEAEKPLLINPVLDDPSEHFDLEETGVLKPKTSRGETTIKVLGLNRENLRINRRNAINVAQKLWLLLLQAQSYNNALEEEDYRRQIFEIATGRAAYTMACLKGLVRGLLKHKGTLDAEAVRNIVMDYGARQAQAPINDN